MANNSDCSIEGCWAACLGNCGGGISREHLISECLFRGQEIFVQGFDWCSDAPKSVRIESLTGKILCKSHNSELSAVDAVAGIAFGAIRSAVKLNEERGRFPYLSWAFQQSDVDGPGLERWFLKTLINMSFGQKWIIGPGGHARGTVPDHLVRIAFGYEQFPEGAGLYTGFRTGETFMLEDRITFTPKTSGENLMIGKFVFRGLRFYLNLLPERFTTIDDSNLFYRRSQFGFLIGDRPSHRITLCWP